MSQPRLAVVILNTNRRDDTLTCLASLSANTYPEISIIVLDNASTDGSVEAVQAAYPAVQILELTENKGYAGNNNAGIAAALEQGADWVVVLNEDTVLDPECVNRLVAVGERDPEIGIIGPLVYHHDEPGVIQSAGGTFGPGWSAVHLGQNEPDQGQFTTPRRVAWISGCCIMVRREVIEQVGMLDERFFYYWEETDWCLSASEGGWKIVQVPNAKLWHKGVQRDYRPGPSIAYYNTRNRLLVLSKHHAPLAVRLRVWAQIGRTLASYSLRPKWRAAKRADRDAIWRGAQDYRAGRWGKMPPGL
jgi:hypothetical protein